MMCQEFCQPLEGKKKGQFFFFHSAFAWKSTRFGSALLLYTVGNSGRSGIRWFVAAAFVAPLSSLK